MKAILFFFLVVIVMAVVMVALATATANFASDEAVDISGSTQRFFYNLTERIRFELGESLVCIDLEDASGTWGEYAVTINTPKEVFEFTVYRPVAYVVAATLYFLVVFLLLFTTWVIAFVAGMAYEARNKKKKALAKPIK